MIVCGDEVILSEVVSGGAGNSSIFVLSCIIPECCGKSTYKLFKNIGPPGELWAGNQAKGANLVREL